MQQQELKGSSNWPQAKSAPGTPMWHTAALIVLLLLHSEKGSELSQVLIQALNGPP